MHICGDGPERRYDGRPLKPCGMVTLFLVAAGVLVVISIYSPGESVFLGQERPQLTALPKAVVLVRVEPNKLPVHVTQRKRPLAIPRFHELVVAMPSEGKEPLEKLVGEKVSVVPSPGDPRRWEVYAGAVWSPASMNLPDNVFVVKQVFLSTYEDPVELSSGGRVHKLKPGHAILVLR